MESPEIQRPSVFFKVRSIAFGCISLTCFIWTVLLCLVVFLYWSAIDRSERSLIVVLLVTNVVTIIMLLILLLRQFRPWLDAARIAFLLVVHIGCAGSFTYWNSKFICPSETADAEGLCRLLNMYILLASWVVPALLLVYACGLSVMLHRRHSLGSLETNVLDCEKADDGNFTIGRPSILPVMAPDVLHWKQTQSPTSISFTNPAIPFPPNAMRNSRGSSERNSGKASWSRESWSPSTGQKRGSSRVSTSTATRLSKPLRMSYY